MTLSEAPRSSATNGQERYDEPPPERHERAEEERGDHHGVADDRAHRRPLLVGRLVKSGLGKEEEHEKERDEAQAAHRVERGADAEVVGERPAEQRPEAERREERHVEGAELRALLALRRDVTDVGLGDRVHHARGRPVEHANDDERDDAPGHGVREGEDGVERETDDEEEPSPEPVRQPSYERHRDELSEREAREDESEREAVGAEFTGVERHEGTDEPGPQSGCEQGGEQDEVDASVHARPEQRWIRRKGR